MTETLTPDLCVIGAGSAGLAVAAGAQQMGAETVLIEKHKMGGDCLNTGCVPSKALLAAGKAAQLDRLAAKYGVGYAPPRVDFAARPSPRGRNALDKPPRHERGVERSCRRQAGRARN